MIRPVSVGVSLALLILVSVSCSAQAAKPLASLEVGSVTPKWSDLAGTDGKQHALDDYKDAKLVVLVFTTNSCPVAVAYEDRLIELQKKYAPKGVQVVAINCNTDASNNLKAMITRAEDKGFNFPYLYDESQDTGRDYGATVTPHVFVLDGARKLAYVGAIDDNMNATKVKQHYLGDALDAILEGKTPTETQTKQFGCGIRYH